MHASASVPTALLGTVFCVNDPCGSASGSFHVVTLVLRVEDGRTVALGSDEELANAQRDMADATGGSSAMGRWSRLFGLGADDAMPVEWSRQLGEEAADFRQTLGHQLDDATILLLDRLAALRSDPE